MIEYPSVPNSSKAPRKPMIAFDKLDGSNIRVKYTAKRGFDLFGSRTQLLDKTHPFLGGVVDYFNNTCAEPLTKVFKKEFPNEREIIVFGEYFGTQSFAGIHVLEDDKKFVLFDVLIGHKDRKFVMPRQFIKLFSQLVEIPRVVCEGNLSDQFIKDVRENKYNTNEGVICKGLEKTGAARGGVWMCKIKTQSYFDRLLTRYGEEGLQKYGE
jgi:hypothetical protein